MSSLPSFAASTRSSSNWCGVRCTGSPATRDRALLEVDDELADLDHRLAGRRRARRSTARSRASSSSIPTGFVT